MLTAAESKTPNVLLILSHGAWLSQECMMTSSSLRCIIDIIMCSRPSIVLNLRAMSSVFPIPSVDELSPLVILSAVVFLCRKLIRRLATPDLMFGHMVAPPPSTTKDLVGISDMLSCFSETGSPARSDLSPIAMVTSPPQVIALFPGLRRTGRRVWY